MQYSKELYDEIVKQGWAHRVTLKGRRLVVITVTGKEVEIWNDYCATAKMHKYAIGYALAQVSLSIHSTVLD